MEIISLPAKFEWDKHNAEKIKIKHGIEPAECEEVFLNMPLVIKPDIGHSQTETRYHAMGKTNAEKLLFIVFTIRNKRIRIITARAASRKERRMYHETT